MPEDIMKIDEELRFAVLLITLVTDTKLTLHISSKVIDIMKCVFCIIFIEWIDVC
jgi:hypothetical protein